MCVAIFKPAGAETPSLAILKECWDKNPDGAGLAISERSTVFYRKGFMKFAELEDFYYSNNLAGRVGQAMVFHFRIGTHGNKDAGNTHPFCISDDLVILRTLTGRVSSVIAHNGIFHLTPKLPKISDTGQFVVDCVHASGGDPIKHWADHPEVIGWSKLVVLLPANRFKLLGTWSIETTDSCGSLFSNMFWKSYVVGKGTGGYSGYGYGCGEGYFDDDDVRHIRRNYGVMRKCVVCDGTGISVTGRVRCSYCSGTGYVRDTSGNAQSANKPTDQAGAPATDAAQQTEQAPASQPVRVITAGEGHQPPSAVSKIADAAKAAFSHSPKDQKQIKVWSKEKKDFVVAGAAK